MSIFGPIIPVDGEVIDNAVYPLDGQPPVRKPNFLRKPLAEVEAGQ